MLGIAITEFLWRKFQAKAYASLSGLQVLHLRKYLDAEQAPVINSAQHSQYFAAEGY
jgi:hypothetical protein